MAVALLRAGMKVVGCARRLEALETLAEEAGGGECLALRCDLRNESEILAMFEQIRERWGGVDVLVNNAGLGHEAPLLSGATDKWRETLELNVLALAVCTREAVNDMRERDVRGHVLHISSMSAHRVPAGAAMYSASKYAVRAMTEGLRAELRAIDSEIRVTAVSPGFVETEFAATMLDSEERAREVYSRYPVLQADDIARAVVYALEQPAHVQVHDILMRPTRQPN